MAFNLACPKCRAVIKSATPIRAGKSVKCPKCNASFSAPPSPSKQPGSKMGVIAKQPGSKMGVLKQPGSKAGVCKPGGSKHAVKKPSVGKPNHNGSWSPSSAFDFDAPGPAVSTSDSTPPRKKRRGSKLLMYVLSVVILLSLAGVGGGAFILMKVKNNGWAGLFGKKSGGDSGGSAPGDGVNDGSGEEDLVAYLPSDSSFLGGADLGSLMNHPGIKAQIEDRLSKDAPKVFADCKKETGLELKELFNRVFIGSKGSLANGPDIKLGSTTFVVRSSVPFDQKKVAKWLSNDSPQKIKDKYYYRKIKEAPDDVVLFMPSDRVLIIGPIPEAKLESVLTNDGTKPTLAGDSVNLVRQVQTSSLWAVCPFDAAAKQDLQGTLMPLAGTVPDLQPAVRAFQNAKAGVVSVRLEGDKARLSLGLALASETDAGAASVALQGFWDKLKGLAGSKFLEGLGSVSKDIQTVARDALDSTRFSKSGNVAEVSASVSLDAAEGLAKKAQTEMPLLMASMDTINKAASDSLKVEPAKPMPKVEADKPLVLTPEEKGLLDLINQARKQNGDKPPLTINPKLFAMARAHAANMAKVGQLEDEIDEKDTSKRATEIGYKFAEGKIDFNIAVGKDPNIHNAYNNWMGALASKSKLLDAFEETGLGIAKSEKGEFFYYQVYAVPAK